MFCHIGNGPDLLGPLWKVVKETQIPIQTFLPTHMERSEALINDGVNWVKAGGYVDFSCRTLKVSPPPSVCVFLSLSLSFSLSLYLSLFSLCLCLSLSCFRICAAQQASFFPPLCRSSPQHPLVV